MSRRSEIQLTTEEQARFYKNTQGALATLDKDGFPHVVAMGFLAKDGAIYMIHTQGQKVVNIRRTRRSA